MQYPAPAMVAMSLPADAGLAAGRLAQCRAGVP